MAEPILTRVRSSVSQERLRCPYCHDQLERRRTKTCERCQANHHEDCFDIYGGCAVFGCLDRSRPSARFFALQPKEPEGLWMDKVWQSLWLGLLGAGSLGAVEFFAWLMNTPSNNSSLNKVLLSLLGG